MEKESNARKEEVETLNRKIAELTTDDLTQVSGGADWAPNAEVGFPGSNGQLYKCDHCGQPIHAPSDFPFLWFGKECHFCKQGHFKMV